MSWFSALDTFHAILLGLMIIGSLGIYLYFVRRERIWRDAQPFANDMDGYARQFAAGQMYSRVGVLLAALDVAALRLLW